MRVTLDFNSKQARLFRQAMWKMRLELGRGISYWETDGEFVMECILAEFLQSRKGLEPPFSISGKNLDKDKKPPF